MSTKAKLDVMPSPGGQEHQRDLRNKLRSSPLVSHMEAQHPNTVPDFKMVILANFTTPLARQIEEAETIEVGSSNPLSMNSRAEWGSTPIPQLGVTQSRVPRDAMPVFHTSNILSQPTAAPQGQQAPLLGTSCATSTGYGSGSSAGSSGCST